MADRTGRYRSGLSDDERKALKEDLDAIWAVTRAVLALAGTPLAPVELASRLEYWHCPGIRAKLPVALDWLHRFEEPVPFPSHFLGLRRRWEPLLVPYRSSAP